MKPCYNRCSRGVDQEKASEVQRFIVSFQPGLYSALLSRLSPPFHRSGVGDGARWPC